MYALSPKAAAEAAAAAAKRDALVDSVRLLRNLRCTVDQKVLVAALEQKNHHVGVTKL